MDDLKFLVDKSISISKRLFIFIKIQSRLLWNKTDNRKPSVFEKYESLILASLYTLNHIRISFPEIYLNFEKCIYYELRSVDDFEIKTQLRKIQEEFNFINNRFYIYQKELFSEETDSWYLILDKLYVNPLSESNKLYSSFEDPIAYMKLFGSLSIGLKYLDSTLNEVLPKFIDLNKEENSKLNTLKGLNLSSHLDSILRYNLYGPGFNPGFYARMFFPLNNIMINYSEGYSYYMRIYESKYAIFFSCFGYPILDDINGWFNLENPNVFVGKVDLHEHGDVIEIEFNLESTKIYLKGEIIDQTMACKLSKVAKVFEEQEKLFEGSKKFILCESKANYSKVYIGGKLQYYEN